MIEYAPSTPLDGRLQLQVRDDRLTVTWPVLPRWVLLPLACLPLVVSLIASVQCLLLTRLFWRMFFAHGPTTPAIQALARHVAVVTLIPIGLSCIFWVANGVFQLWKYWRWGRVPRVLRASADGLTLSNLGMWRMRFRDIAADEIASIEIRSMRGNLTPWRTAATLIIRRTHRRRLRFSLVTSDASLPGRIAEELARVLHRPLQQHIGRS